MKNSFYLILLILISTNLYALPIDWHGQFGANTILHKSASYLDLKNNSPSQGTAGSQEIKLASGNNDELNTQTYIFTLSPDILVNDAVTLHTEFSSGYARGGNFGDNSSQNSNTNNGGLSNALYPHNFSGTNSGLLVNKLYMELFTDSAIYLIGRYYDHFGLGAVVNDGSKPWDRFATTRDGFMLKVKLGNFNIHPFWSKIVSGKENADGTKIKEFGASLVYDNMDRDLALGVLLSKKQASASNTFLQSSTNTGTAAPMGKTDTTLIDIYLKKKIGNFDIALEAPIFSGKIGAIAQADTSYDANAILIQTNYKISSSWTFGLDLGKVSGDAGTKSKFSAMYLNPNFQIANILFRYNRNSLANTSGNENLYDTYVNNVMFLKLKSQLSNADWTWNFNLIYAQAVEVASTSQANAYNHLTNRYYAVAANQEKNMGIELDVDFNFAYNEELSFQGSFGYLKTGDYFIFTNTATPNIAKSAYALTLSTNVAF